jgi:hypothetical protein
MKRTRSLASYFSPIAQQEQQQEAIHCSTESRNKMGDDWLNHRMVCYVEREIFAAIKDDDILHHFQELKTRKMKLPNLSSSSGMLHSLIQPFWIHDEVPMRLFF